MSFDETFEGTLANLPEGWSFTHLTALDPSGFQCNLVHREDCVVVTATGDTPAEAVHEAGIATYNAKNFLHMYVPSDHASFEGPLRTSLDIAKLFLRPKEPINRRL